MPEQQPAASAGVHVAERWGPYLLGTLTAEEEHDVEAHLLRCAACRGEGDALSEVAVTIAVLPEATVREVMGSPDELRPPTVPAPRPGPPSTPARPGPPPSSGPPGSTRPAGRPSTPRRRLRALVVPAAALVAGLALGAGALALLRPVEAPATPVGSESTSARASDLTVTVADHPGGGTDVRVSAAGLRPGVEFVLIAVVNDGRTYEVVRGVAAGGPQTVVGTVPVAASQVWFYAVVQAGGEVLLVAPGR